MTLLTLWIIAGLVVLLAITSMLPFSVYVKGARSDEDFSYQTAFHWPFKAFGVGIRRDARGRYIQLLCGNRRLYEHEMRKKKDKKRKKEKEKKKKSSFNLLRDRKLLDRLIRSGLRFLSDLLRCFRRPRLAGYVEIGFADPAAMGVLSGFVYAISRRGMVLDDLKIRSNYVDAVFIGEAALSTGARPACVATVLIKALFYFPIRELLRLRKRKKEVS